MKHRLRRVIRWFYPALAIIGLVWAISFLWQEALSDKAFGKQLEQELSTSIQGLLRTAHQHAGEYAALPSRIPKVEGVQENLFFRYVNGVLTHYSSSRWVPEHLPEEWKPVHPLPEVYLQGQDIYVPVRYHRDSLIAIVLIPLKVVWPIRNPYLIPYLFLGLNSAFYQISDRLVPSDLQAGAGDINIINEKGTVLANYNPRVIPLFRYPYRMQSIPGLILFAIGGFGLLFRLFRKVFNPLWKASLWIGLLLICIRVISFLSGFPAKWISLDLFSPRILAMNEWNPSLGDLGLNLLTIFFILYFLIPAIPLQKIKVSAILIWIILGSFIWALAFSSFYLLGEMSSNSQINLFPESLLEMDFYSLVFFISTALITGICWLLLFRIGTAIYSWKKFAPVKPWSIIVSLFTLGIIAGIWLPGGQWGAMLSFAGLAWLALMQGYYSNRRGLFRLSFLDTTLAILAMAWVTETSIAISIRERQDHLLLRMASKFYDSRDPIAEYLFGEMVAEIRKESSLIKKIESTGKERRNLADVLMQDYLQPGFKSYQPKLYLYNSYGMRLDHTPWTKPMITPFRDHTGYESVTNLSSGGELFLVPYEEEELIDKIYVGRFNFSLPGYGNILAIVEFIPKTIPAPQLYPRLLLDDKVPQKEFFSSVSFAVYKEGNLIKQAGTADFPFQLELTPPDPTTTLVPQAINGMIKLERQLTPDKFIYLQLPARTLTNRLVAISILFFLYYFLCLPLWGDHLFKRIHRIPAIFRNLLFVQKLRILLLSFSAVPFLGILFLYVPFIQSSFEKELYGKIHADLQQVSGQLSSESRIWLKGDNIRAREELRSILMRARDHYNLDMNLYDRGGKLMATTQPRIFTLGLISPRISFGAWEDLMITHHSFTIRAEQIGNLRYLSGYILLFGADQKPLACLNIPYLSQQEILDTRIRDFLSVLGYIYLVVLLILGGLSLVFSRYMTRPLTLLRQRLDATILGGENKPLEVKTQDEIGTIAKSYNQMLVKLRASEAQLGQTQREMAWREMARQVAHEIKNPLTPMKLSLQHLLRAWKDQHPQREEILNSVTTSVLLQIDSLATIATAFSTFATLPQPQIKLFDVKELLQQTADLYQQGPEGAVILELPEHPIIMKADPEQIGRVLQNLVKNGLQSLNENGIVKLSLSEIPSGILIIVEDNGSGIPDEIRPHIFEPNFSTKTSGMGLGLALVRRIVEGSGGTIRFESEIENGTRFYLEFPKAD